MVTISTSPVTEADPVKSVSFTRFVHSLAASVVELRTLLAMPVFDWRRRVSVNWPLVLLSWLAMGLTDELPVRLMVQAYPSQLLGP